MGIFRVVAKLIFLLLATLFFYLLIVLGNILKYFGVNKYLWSVALRKHWSKTVAKIIAMKVSFDGEIPKAPFFLVSNHLSYVDVWVFYSLLSCTFIAKSEVRAWPVIGFVLATSGVVFIDRTKRSDVKRVNDEISKNLNTSQGIVLFPEGTTSAGAEILPFKSSLFQYPAENLLPVHCASIHYSTNDEKFPAFRTVCWWDNILFSTHLITLLKMKKFSATVTFNQETITNSNRKTLANSAEEIVKKSFKPVVQSHIYATASAST